MVNSQCFNSMTDEKFTKLEEILGSLEGKSVMVNFSTGIFNVLYEEECFYGWTDNGHVYIGGIEYSPSIEKTNVIDMVFDKIGYSVNVELALRDGSLIKVYN